MTNAGGLPLVAGIGSPFGADRLGWAVIESLRETFPDLPARLVCCSLPAELTPLLLTHPRAIVIDALLGDGPPGRVHVLHARDLPARSLRLSSHGHGLIEAVQLAEALGHPSPALRVIALDVVQPDAEIRPEWLAAAVEAVLAQLAKG